MPTYKISQLTTATAVSATNQFEINQNGTSKSVEVSVIDAYIKSTSNLPVVVSVSSATDAVRITQTGTGNALVVEDSTNPDATPFVVDASGNVGIGTSSPGNKLDIVSAGSSQIRVKDGVNATAYYDFGRDGTDGFFGFSGAQASFSGYKWSINAGSEVMRITNGGNVGIGTSSPQWKLHIYDSSAPIIMLEEAAVGNTFIGQDSDTFFIRRGTIGAANALIIDSSGNVGIGTSLPDSTRALTLNRTGNYGGIEFQVNGSTQARLQQESTGSLYIDSGITTTTGSTIFRTANGSERMRIDSSGNVGIGTSSPGNARLNTQGYGSYRGNAFTIASFAANSTLAPLNIVQATDGSIPGISAGQNSSAQFSSLGFYTSETERMRIDSSGNVRVGTAAIATTATDGFLYVPTCAGTPTGTPTAITGLAPIVIDSTNNKLYFYSGGVWRDAGP